VLLRVHAKQIFVRRRSRLDDFAALFLEGRGQGLQRLRTLGPLGVTRGGDVIDEARRADNNQ